MIANPEQRLRSRVQSQPGDHAGWHELGLLYLGKGDPALAAQCIEAAVDLSGKTALYQRNLCEIYRRMGRLDQARKAGEQAAQLAPDSVDAHYNLGLVHSDAGNHALAIASYRRALELDPRHNRSWNNLGTTLEQSGDQAGALHAYQQAVLCDPGHIEARNNVGAILSAEGALDEAREAFNAAIALRPDFVEAHYNLSSLKKYTPDDPHLAMLRRCHERRHRLTEDARIRCNFALGKALDDIGDFDAAFAAYDEGNSLQHALCLFDEARADAMLAEIMQVFDERFFAERKDWRGTADPQRTPIFIVGMPRSGTTLLEQILSSHTSVHGAGELSELHDCIVSATKAGPDHPFAAGVTHLSEADLKRLGDDYLQRVWQLSPDSRFITDKMPANFFYLGLIHLALPNARIIHAMRDPMDSCFSCYSRLFNETMEFTYDQGALGRYYARYMTLMRHWHAVLPKGTILDLPYEDMVADVEGQARRVLEFVGLPWEPKCLEFYDNQRQVKTASVAQVRRPIYQSSIARWKHFARHLRPLYELVKDFRPDDGADELFDAPPPVAPVSTTDAKAVRLHRQGLAAWQAGRVPDALQAMKEAAECGAELAVLHSDFAEMNRQVGHLDAAIEQGEIAVRIDPRMAAAYSNLGIALFDAGRLDEAEVRQHTAL